MTPDTSSPPVRVAIIGSGPAAFYTAEHLLKAGDGIVSVDMFERLPAPFGLVRYGVAPDHQKIKQVTRVFDRIAQHPGFRFYGNVEYGKHLELDDLRHHYHQVCFATGAQTDRELGIPGEELERSHPATEFVAWYNGHPDFRHCRFDLTAKRVVIVGVGNVAVDVARILCRTPAELAQTDIAEYALGALQASQVQEVIMLGRRGPAQAAFTNPEAKELGELEGADTLALPDEVVLDPATSATLGDGPDRDLTRKLEILHGFAAHLPTGKPRRLILRFLVSPAALLDDGRGGVGGVRLIRNRLEEDDHYVRAIATTVQRDMPADLVFRSVGYRGVALPGIPFDNRRGTIPNERGRIVDPQGDAVQGLYVSGWIKRGPTGVIGTNKPDGKETAEAMLADAAAGRTLVPDQPGAAAAETLLRARQADIVSYADWQRIDAAETAEGTALGRPRVKLTDPAAMLRAVGKAPALG